MLCGTSQLPTVASMSLVLLSTLWLIVQAQGNFKKPTNKNLNFVSITSLSLAIAIKPTPELQPYEVVRPKKLHILHKREIQNNQTEKHGKEERYEPELQYQMILNGEEVILRLQKANTDDHTGILAFITTMRVSCNFLLSTGISWGQTTLKHITHPEERKSQQALRTWGYFTHHNQRHMIKPLKITDQEEHAVLIYNQEELDPANHTCGVRNVGRKQGLIRTSRSLKRPEVEDIINNVLSLFVKKDFLQAEKYIDLFLVLDNAFYNMYNRNITLIRSFVFDVINLLNVVRYLFSKHIYNTIDIQVVLIGMEIWSDGDKIKVVPNTGVTFNNFLNWHRSNLGKMKIHDHAQLLSGVGFRNRITGLAASNSLCSPSSVAVIENSVHLVYRKKKYLNLLSHCLCALKECANPCCEAMTCMLKPEADCGKNSKP
ncbi:hypothetical protein J1605_016677 [Eschrichtius robustus]|uniref:Peptidase M12B domain-containing protein n=1 Tax=Eschrichtius robustus TaxID=9764 RepID=A0AB34I5A8_ESCRO|nr:hypothetical protein J1605_016677 [Eschrichtius robustus]